MKPLELLDAAHTAAKRAAHSLSNERARRHMEYALALLNEAWVAEDGQNARTPEGVCKNVKDALDLFEACAPREEGFAEAEKRQGPRIVEIGPCNEQGQTKLARIAEIYRPMYRDGEVPPMPETVIEELFDMWETLGPD